MCAGKQAALGRVRGDLYLPTYPSLIIDCLLYIFLWSHFYAAGGFLFVPFGPLLPFVRVQRYVCVYTRAAFIRANAIFLLQNERQRISEKGRGGYLAWYRYGLLLLLLLRL